MKKVFVTMLVAAMGAEAGLVVERARAGRAAAPGVDVGFAQEARAGTARYVGSIDCSGRAGAGHGRDRDHDSTLERHRAGKAHRPNDLPGHPEFLLSEYAPAIRKAGEKIDF